MSFLYTTFGSEYLNFQGKEFGLALEALFQEIIDSKVREPKAMQELPAVQKIVDLTFSTRGIKLDLRLDSEMTDSVYFPVIETSHVFLEDYVQRYFSEKGFDAQTVQLFRKNPIGNYIDLTNGGVRGALSEMAVVLNIDIVGDLAEGYGAKHITAAFLHELGHVWSAFYCSFMQSRLNAALSMAARVAISNFNVKQRQVIFADLAREALGREIDVSTIPQDAPPAMVVVGFIKAVYKEKKSLTSSTEYDFSLCEHNADIYCARFGYYREFVEALDMTHRAAGVNISTFGKASAIFAEIIMVSLAIIGPILTAIVSGPVAALIVAAMTFYLFIFTDNGSARGISNYLIVYDTARVRFARIREQAIEHIKQTKMSKEDKQGVLKAIEVIDKYIDETKVHTPLLTRLFNMFGDNKRVMDQMELQRQLERLAANDLFIGAARLQTV
jgi:hypothetical protein